MSIREFLRRCNPLHRGVGESYRTAIVVQNVPEEYQYVTDQYGRPGADWKLCSQSLVERRGKSYDVLTIRLATGRTQVFYFDISGFLPPDEVH